MIRGSGSRRSSRQSRRDRRNDVPLHRVAGVLSVKATDEHLDCRVVLNDLSPSGVGCFVPSSVEKGARVQLSIEQPAKLLAQGEVIWCSPYTLDTRILSAEQFTFRVGIQFEFNTDAERDSVEMGCKELLASLKQR